MLDATLAPVPDTSARRMLVDRVAAARASGDARRLDIAERTLAGFDAKQRAGAAMLVPAAPVQRSTEDLCRETIARHPATVALVQRLPRLAAAIAVGAILTVVDVAVMSERADAAREAWIAALEAEGDADLPTLPGELAWDPRVSALVPAVGA